MEELSRVTQGIIDTDCSFFGHVDCDSSMRRAVLAHEAEDLMLRLFSLLQYVIENSAASRSAFVEKSRVRLLLHFVQR